MISTVEEFKVGQIVNYKGIEVKIVKFKSRSSLCLKNISPQDGEWVSCKTSIKDLRKNITK